MLRGGLCLFDHREGTNFSGCMRLYDHSEGTNFSRCMWLMLRRVCVYMIIGRELISVDVCGLCSGGPVFV